MTKNNLFKIIAIVFLLFMLVGLVFFRKGGDEVLNPNPVPADDQQAKEPDEKRELTEEEKAKIFAENFTATYYSYAWGNFSNVESLENIMTQDLWNKELEWISAEKEKVKNQPIIYTGISNVPQKAKIVYLKQGGAKIELECEQYETEGASVYINDILTGIDKFGKESSVHPIYRRMENKKVILELLKKDDEWKVDWIGEK